MRVIAVMILCLGLPAVALGQDDAASESAPAQLGPADLAGTWVQKVVTTAVSDVPIIGEVTSRTVALQRVQLTHQDDQLAMQIEACDVRVNSSVDAIKTHIPDRFVHALSGVSRPARLEHEAGGSRFVVPRHVFILGMHLREPSSEYLPTEANDPRVFDQDRDGYPGVTVRVSGLIDGKLFLVHRGWDRREGRIVDRDRIRGRVEWRKEQIVLDSTSIFLGQPPDTHPHPDAAQSFFRMHRVDDTWTCEKLVAKQQTVFADKGLH